MALHPCQTLQQQSNLILTWDSVPTTLRYGIPGGNRDECDDERMITIAIRIKNRFGWIGRVQCTSERSPCSGGGGDLNNSLVHLWKGIDGNWGNKVVKLKIFVLKHNANKRQPVDLPSALCLRGNELKWGGFCLTMQIIVFPQVGRRKKTIWSPWCSLSKSQTMSRQEKWSGSMQNLRGISHHSRSYLQFGTPSACWLANSPSS